jgi:hypothetical protein
VGFVIEKACPAGDREPVPMPGPGKVHAVVPASRESSLQNDIFSNIIATDKAVREIIIYG